LKRNGNRPETAPLVEDILGGSVIAPHAMQLNPLARALGMTFEEQYVMVEAMFQFMAEIDLTPLDKNMLGQNLRYVYENAEDPSFSALHQAFGDFYVKPAAEGESQTLEQRFANEMYESAFKLQKITDSFRSGVYGRVFSGDGEAFVSLIEQRIQSWDFKNIEGKLRSLIEIVINAIDTSAIMPDPDLDKDDPQYGMPKHPERIANYIAQDEAYEALGNLHFIRAEYRRMKTQREHGSTTVMLFHRLSDLQNAIGAAGSEQARLADNMLNEIEVWLIGRQTKKELPVLRAFFDLPEYVLQSLPTLPKGHFWVVAPWHRAPFEIVVIGSPLDIEAFNTDQANHKLLRKYRETGNLQHYFDFLEETTPDIDEEGVVIERQ
jgi:hypothetical protein